jgi:hypothetical protein
MVTETNGETMNKIVFSIIICAVAILTTGCVQQACVNDNYCDINEKVRGNCNDCKPDFVVINSDNSHNVKNSHVDDKPYANYNPQTQSIDARFCAEFVNYDGSPVKYKMYYGSNKESRTNEATYTWDGSKIAEGSFGLDIKNGQVEVMNNLRINSQTNKINCFYHTFTDVKESNGYFIGFVIDVNDKNNNNNYADTKIQRVYPVVNTSQENVSMIKGEWKSITLELLTNLTIKTTIGDLFLKMDGANSFDNYIFVRAYYINNSNLTNTPLGHTSPITKTLELKETRYIGTYLFLNNVSIFKIPSENVIADIWYYTNPLFEPENYSIFEDELNSIYNITQAMSLE